MKRLRTAQSASVCVLARFLSVCLSHAGILWAETYSFPKTGVPRLLFSKLKLKQRSHGRRRRLLNETEFRLSER